MGLRLPEEIARIVEGYQQTSIPTVNSGSVIKLQSGEVAPLFLKIEPRPSTLEHEVARLNWLESKLKVARVVSFCSSEIQDFLLLTAIPGDDSTEDLADLDLHERVDLVAKGLKQIHQVDIADCPFDRTLQTELRLARERVEQGLITEDDLEDHQKGRSIDGILRYLEEQRPAHETLAFTHGDYSLPNIMLNGGQVSGFLDWRDGGIGDPYRDLPIVAKSIVRNWGEEWLEPFYRSYGLQAGLDQEKMQYYRLLYRFF